MRVSEWTIERVLSAPEISHPNGLGHPKGTMYVGGKYVIPVAEDGTILTVLWRGGAGR
jgi:hypothetical protein